MCGVSCEVNFLLGSGAVWLAELGLGLVRHDIFLVCGVIWYACVCYAMVCYAMVRFKILFYFFDILILSYSYLLK